MEKIWCKHSGTFQPKVDEPKKLVLNKDLNNMTLKQLRLIASTVGVEAGKTKAETIKNIENA